MTCVYGCQKDGTPCPRPHTCHTIGVIKKHQDAQCCTGNCRQGRDCTRASYGMLDVVKDVAWVLIGVALVAGLAGWLAQFFRG